MAKPVTLKVGRFLLLVASLLLIGAAAGIVVAALHWRIHGFVALSAPVQILGLLAFIVLMMWKTLEAGEPGKPLGL